MIDLDALDLDQLYPAAPIPAVVLVPYDREADERAQAARRASWGELRRRPLPSVTPRLPAIDDRPRRDVDDPALDPDYLRGSFAELAGFEPAAARSKEYEPLQIDDSYYRRSGESWDAFSRRRMRSQDWLNRVDRILGFPRALKLVALLGSEVSVETKKRAVRHWLAWSHEFVAPCLPAWPGGLHESALWSAIWLHRQPEWDQYQRELAGGREERRAARDRTDEHKQRRARQWLETNRFRIIAGIQPRAQADKRLAVLGVSYEEWIAS